MELDITPAPSDEERAAIEAALEDSARAGEQVPAWAAAVAPGAEEDRSTQSRGA